MVKELQPSEAPSQSPSKLFLHWKKKKELFLLEGKTSFPSQAGGIARKMSFPTLLLSRAKTFDASFAEFLFSYFDLSFSFFIILRR